MGGSCEPRETRLAGSERLWDLIQANINYVNRMAREYRNFGIEAEDLRAEGILGLIEAADRFDRTRGVKFLTYATWWVRKKISDTVAHQVSLVPLSRHRLERLRRIRAAERDLLAQMGRQPGSDEIAGQAGLPTSEVERLVRLSRRDVSLDEVVNSSSGLRYEDILVQRQLPQPGEDLMREDESESLMILVEQLPRRPRLVVKMRYGLGGFEPVTLSRIARGLGISRERVRQIERSALASLRRIARERDRAYSPAPKTSA